MQLIYLNGKIVNFEDAKVSVFDRGFMFGDGAYEVIRVYKGKPFHLEEHLERLKQSLNFLRIRGAPDLKPIVKTLLDESQEKEATIYIQITRGVVKQRAHAFDDAFPDSKMSPTVFLYVNGYADTKADLRENGCKAVTYPDLRWKRCDIKSINLLGNIFAAQEAKESDVYEAILVNSDNRVVEGSHTNVFAVIGGKLYTMPLGKNILPGITRKIICELAQEARVATAEESFSKDQLMAASEVFLAGTTTEIIPVIEIDGKKIGDGVPGPISKKLQHLFFEKIK